MQGRPWNIEIHVDYRSLKLLLLLTNPAFQVFIWNFLALILFIIVPDKLVQVFASESKILSLKGLFWYLILTLSFIVGVFIPPRFLLSSPVDKVMLVIKREWIVLSYLSLLLCILGYLVWFRDFLINFSEVLQLFVTFGAYKTRELLKGSMITGVTTLTQFGIASSILFMILYLFLEKRRYLFFSLLPLILAIPRVVFFGERLAFIEVFIPIIFVYLRYRPYKFKYFLIIAILLFSILWATELFRSYLSPAYNSSYTPLEFLLYRFIMYFVTTVNNGFLIFDKFMPLMDLFPHSLLFVYKILHAQVQSSVEYDNLLRNFANPEYNNKSAWGVLYYDWGEFSVIIAFVLGWLSKLVYYSYKKGTFLGIVFYPVFLVFLFQSYRVLYILSSRVYYTYVLLVFLYLIYEVKVSIAKVNNEYSS